MILSEINGNRPVAAPQGYSIPSVFLGGGNFEFWGKFPPPEMSRINPVQEGRYILDVKYMAIATDCLIFATFCTMTQNLTEIILKCHKWQTYRYLKYHWLKIIRFWWNFIRLLTSWPLLQSVTPSTTPSKNVTDSTPPFKWKHLIYYPDREQ